MLNYLSGKNIIVVGLQPWDIEIGSNCKNIALELSRTNNVLYVNRALDRMSMIKFRNHPRIKSRLDSIKGKKPDLDKINDRLWAFNPKTIVESFTRVPLKPVFNYFNQLNNRRIAKEIIRAGHQLDFSDPIIFVDNDFFRASQLKHLIPNQLFIYYIRDFLVNQRHFRPHGARMEIELVRKADLVLTNSIHLQEYGRKHNKNAHFIGQGFDVELFTPQKNVAIPVDLKNIPGPVIGYVGFITVSRLDEKLLLAIARAKPDWSIVLVGPEDEFFVKSELHQLKNVYFLGHKEKKDLSAYVKCFDVCINPQLKNEQTEGNYPLKIDEYLAMGKPVVATQTKAMEMFKQYTYLGSNPSEYVDHIQSALEENGQLEEKRITFARSHTWEQCIHKMDQIICATIKGGDH